MNTPRHQLHAFAGKRTSYALLVGVLNEGEKFTRQLHALQAYREQVDILVVDGGSNDGATTPEILKTQATALLINDAPERGLSVQYRIGIGYALAQGYEGIIMMDGNGKDGPEAIPVFLAALEAGYDFLQGSRFMPGGSHENTPLDRVLGICCVFNPLMALASRHWYSDAMNGFKACSRRFLEDPRLQPLRPVFKRYSLQYYLNYSAPRLGVRLKEIPVSRRYEAQRHTPQSKIVGVRARLGILAELAGILVGRYNP